MTDKEAVSQVWPDARLDTCKPKDDDGVAWFMYCAMSTLKAKSSRGRNRVANLGAWFYTEAEAWANARSHLPATESARSSTGEAQENGIQVSYGLVQATCNCGWSFTHSDAGRVHLEAAQVAGGGEAE